MMIERKVHFQRKQSASQESTSHLASGGGRVPRVSRLMALAIRLEQLIREGLMTDQAELARLGHVTRARLTQIMNLLTLAPDIQEQILLIQQTGPGRAPVTEKQLRPIYATFCWKKQRQMWNVLTK
ncbi:hypothetical protein NA78x_002729 [Anatilimnocola sp. NA78]|uniref:hypothetical protein n=1 Tax=Anatilimnocola sp. NA78 TaxID=3415683 RepID=UPI003CE517F6